MAYSTPRTWVTGELVTAAYLNSNIRDNITLLANPPSCKVYTSAGPTINNNSLTTVTFNNQYWNTDTNWSSGTNPSRLTVTTAGKYLCWFDIELAMTIAAGQFQAGLFKNGGSSGAQVYQSAPVLNGTIRCAGAGIVALVAADYLELKVYQNTGAGATLTYNDPLPLAGIQWMGQ